MQPACLPTTCTDAGHACCRCRRHERGWQLQHIAESVRRTIDVRCLSGSFQGWSGVSVRSSASTCIMQEMGTPAEPHQKLNNTRAWLNAREGRNLSTLRGGRATDSHNTSLSTCSAERFPSQQTAQGTRARSDLTQRPPLRYHRDSPAAACPAGPPATPPRPPGGTAAAMPATMRALRCAVVNTMDSVPRCEVQAGR